MHWRGSGILQKNAFEDENNQIFGSYSFFEECQAIVAQCMFLCQKDWTKYLWQSLKNENSNMTVSENHGKFGRKFL